MNWYCSVYHTPWARMRIKKVAGPVRLELMLAYVMGHRKVMLRGRLYWMSP